MSQAMMAISTGREVGEMVSVQGESKVLQEWRILSTDMTASATISRRSTTYERQQLKEVGLFF